MSEIEREELRVLMKRIIDIHWARSPDYALDTLFAAIIRDGWLKLPHAPKTPNLESKRDKVNEE